jgi:hypothetical protein
MKFSGHKFYDCAAKFGFSSTSTLSRALKKEFNCNYSQFLDANGAIELQNRIDLDSEEINWRSNLMKNNLWSNSGSSSYGHSFPTALHSVLHHQGFDFDITDVFGFSGFAFFMNATKGLCPSSMSVFDFNHHLDFALENCGLDATHIKRLWDKFDQKDEIRNYAVSQIKEALAEDNIVIAWDAVIPEWCLILEYDLGSDRFLAQYESIQNTLNPDMLGQREIEILDVVIVNKANAFDKQANFIECLKFALNLAKGQFNIDEQYKQGLESYDVFIREVEKFKQKEVTKEDVHSIGYHLNMLVTSRYHGALFISRYSELKAGLLYQKIYLELNKVLSKYNILTACHAKLDATFMDELSEALRLSKTFEKEAIDEIELYIKESKVI